MRSFRFYAVLVIVTFFVSIAHSQTANHWETIIKAENTWRYILPTSEPDTNWRYPGFVDISWKEGQGGFGYGDNDDKTILPNGTLSVYFRKTFEVTDTSKISSLILNADFDDAFVAFINGKEIARGGGLTAKLPGYNSNASYTHEAVMYNYGRPESYFIKKSDLHTFLKNGSNVLSVQLYNDVTTSSDMTGIFYLSAGIKDQSVLYEPTPSWFEKPVDTGLSYLPIVMITTNGSIMDEPKITARMSILDKGPGAVNRISDTAVLTCRIAIETRGSSSQQFPKKSYGLETRTELDSNLNVSLLGLPADNDWILYAPYNDKTFIRDILAYRLGNLMGHYTPRFVFCELYLNGNYNGIYILMEKIKQGANRVNIADLKTTDISGKDLTGGYIFKIDKETGSSNGGWSSIYHPRQLADKYINFIYHYPESDLITPEQKSYLKFFIGQFENALASNNFTDELLGYRKFIDLNSFVDYFIMNEISKNVDGYRISSYFHKDREDRGNRIIAGPLWDYNLAFGNADYYSGNTVNNWVINSIPSFDNWQVPFWWQRFLDDPVFYRTLRERYTQFRGNILKTSNIHHYIDSVALVLRDAQGRNFQKWPVLGTYIWPNPFIGSTYQQEIDYMKNWIADRLAWIDGNLLILDNPGIVKPIVNSIAVVYPNPFSTQLNLEIFPDKAEKAHIEIFDLAGKKLYSEVIPVSNSEKTFFSLTEQWTEVSLLSKGIYILKVSLDSGKEFQCKLMKE